MVKEAPLLKNELSVLLHLFGTLAQSIAGDRLYKKYPNIAQQLIDKEWLIPISDIDIIEVNGGVKKVQWCSEASAYQYPSPFLGWTTVPMQQLKRYAVNRKKCFLLLRELFMISPVSRATVVLDGYVYYLGMTRIEGAYINIYLCARFNHIKHLSDITRALQQQPKSSPSLVVCHRAGVIPLRLPPHMTEVVFDALLVKESTYCQMDSELLAFVVRHHYLPIPQTDKSDVALSFSENYRRVCWCGQYYALTKKQASIVQIVHESGGRIHRDQLRQRANTDEELHRIMRNRVEGQWVLHPLWDTLIVKLGGGYYGFSDTVPTHQIALIE